MLCKGVSDEVHDSYAAKLSILMGLLVSYLLLKCFFLFFSVSGMMLNCMFPILINCITSRYLCLLLGKFLKQEKLHQNQVGLCHPTQKTGFSLCSVWEANVLCHIKNCKYKESPWLKCLKMQSHWQKCCFDMYFYTVLTGTVPPVHDVLVLHRSVASQVELAQVEQSQSQVGHHEGQTQKGVRCGTTFRNTVEFSKIQQPCSVKKHNIGDGAGRQGQNHCFHNKCTRHFTFI